jgi:pimeloyl-ACP methyl ester carboxylesterase
MMAGPTNLLDILVEQNRLMAKSGDVPPQQVPFIEAQVAMVRDPKFDPANPPQGFLLGMPYWWHDLMGDQSALAKKQTTPLLILQGERDFQVPASELEKWQTALAERKDVAYKLFPKLNHFFTEGEGPISTIAEYMVPANVPVYVVEEIANWILPKR